jgi:drug/metabolite transporter (DMT)-like permease
MNKILKAHLALLLAQLIYGASYSITKLAMPQYIHAFPFILIRVSGALVLFWITSLFIQEKMERKDLYKILLLALFGVAGNQLFFFKGLDMTTPINASIMMISNPIIVLILSAFILKEKISSNKIIGISLGVAGALILLLINKNFSLGTDTLLGDIFILINSASWAIYTIMVKPLMKKYNPVTILKWTFLVGLFYVAPFGAPNFHLIDWNNMPFNIYLCVAFVVIAVTYLAYIFNTYALRALSPSVVSIYIYMQPFLASLIAVGMGQDSLDPVKVTSGMLIIAGVFMVSKSQAVV